MQKFVPIVSVDNPSNLNLPSISKTFVEAVDCYLDELTAVASSPVSTQEFYELLAKKLRILTSSDTVAVFVLGPENKFLPAIQA